MPVPLTHAITPEVGDTANAAMESLLAFHKHKQRCKQCRLDHRFCETGLTYERSWITDFEHWQDLRRGK